MFVNKCAFLLVFQVLSTTADFDWCSLTCNDQKHTMCIYKAGGDSCSAYTNGLSADEKQAILDYHNELRQKVAKGEETTGPQPSASDMMQLVWDDEVAEIAQRWVEQCQLEGGHDKCRITKDKVKVGQNYAESSGSGMNPDRMEMLKELVKSWYDEVKDFDPSLVSSVEFNGPVVGHYTQLVWGASTRLGCGLSHKQGDEFEFRLICNYKIAGNFIGEKVYTEGTAASKCSSVSKKYPGLCEPSDKGDTPQSSSGSSSSASSPSSSKKPNKVTAQQKPSKTSSQEDDSTSDQNTSGSQLSNQFSYSSSPFMKVFGFPSGQQNSYQFPSSSFGGYGKPKVQYFSSGSSSNDNLQSLLQQLNSVQSKFPGGFFKTYSFSQ